MYHDIAQYILKRIYYDVVEHVYELIHAACTVSPSSGVQDPCHRGTTTPWLETVTAAVVTLAITCC